MLAFITHGIILKVRTIIINLKYQHQHGMKNLHYLIQLFYSEYDEIVVWFTDQNSKPSDIEDRINLTMVIK